MGRVHSGSCRSSISVDEFRELAKRADVTKIGPNCRIGSPELLRALDEACAAGAREARRQYFADLNAETFPDWVGPGSSQKTK